MKKTIYLLLLVSLSVCLFSCNKDDDTQEFVNTNLIGIYKVNSIKSDNNLRTGGYIGNSTELTPHFTCGEIILEIKPDFTFVWNAQKIYQDFVYNNNNIITSSSDLQCTPLNVNGTVTATTDTSFSLQFTYNNTQETAVFNLVNNKWQYQSTQDIFFQGHATLVDGVDTLLTNAVLTMVYEKI